MVDPLSRVLSPDAEEVFSEYVAHFETVEMLAEFEPGGASHLGVRRSVRPRRHYRSQLASHEEQIPSGSPNFLIEA
jgi:hypothetical protein